MDFENRSAVKQSKIIVWVTWFAALVLLMQLPLSKQWQWLHQRALDGWGTLTEIEMVNIGSFHI